MTEPNKSPAPKGGNRPRKGAAANTPADPAAPCAQSTPNAIRGKLAILAAGAGVEVPAEAGTRPAVDMGQPLASLARELGMLASRQPLFLRNGETLVTVCEITGDTRPMDPPRFCSYVETLCWPYRVGRGDSLGYSRVAADLARVILSADEFRRHVRPLRGVTTVRLPIWRDGTPESGLILMPPGYHAATQMFCVDAVPYDAEADADRARGWFLETIKGFPFDGDRSRAAFVCLMLQPFARLLIPHGEKPLHGIFISNQARSGKSRLAAAVLAPCYGLAASQSLDRNPDELRAVLDAVALENAPYLWLDDMGDLRSRPLNQFMTAARHKARVKGHTRTEEADLQTMVLITGNGLDVGMEIAERSLLVDLWLAEDAAGRRFDLEITDAWLARPDTRARFLAFLFAILRHWCDAGRPIDRDARRAGFEATSRLCGSVVRSAAIGNAFARRESTMGGDSEGEALRALLRAAAERCHPEGGEYRPADLVTLADDLALTDEICPFAKQPAKSLGHKLKLWRGRQLKDSHGRLFQFGDDPRKGRERDRAGSVYRVRYLDKA